MRQQKTSVRRFFQIVVPFAAAIMGALALAAPSPAASSIDVIFRPSTPISKSRYPGLNPRTYILKAGTVQEEGAMPLTTDILVEQDVAIRLRDGVVIRADIYRPVGEEKVPVVMGWSSYGKRASWLTNDVFQHPTRMDVPRNWEDGLNKFEGPNPAYWVAHGYAVAAPDSRGVFMSEGDINAFGEQDARDEYDAIEWLAAQPWTNGKVGLSGTSMLAITQWAVASLSPPHLAAIAPTEGSSDIYRDTLARGGIPSVNFAGVIFANVYGNSRTEDMAAMIQKYPQYNAYWKTKATKLQDIHVPAYITASWTNLVHTGGTFRAWEQISSPEKWLRVHNTHEWNDYYNPQHVDEQRRFFDYYLKGINNGWTNTPRVSLAVLDPGHQDTIYRPEAEFPLKREVYQTYFLNRGEGVGTLTSGNATEAGEVAFEATKHEDGVFRVKFDKETEVTGYIKLKVWVEARGNNDIDLFATVRKLGTDGKLLQSNVVTDRQFMGPNGRLRASMRAIDFGLSTNTRPEQSFDKIQKLKPGQIVPLEIQFWPHSMRWHAGETLELVVGGDDLLVRPEFPNIPADATINKGTQVIHFGGKYDSYLMIPTIPQ